MAKAQPNRTRAETLSLRVAPDLKFGLELLSRLEDRSLTTIIERGLKELFHSKEVHVDAALGKKLNPNSYSDLRFIDALNFIYSVDSPTRIIRAAIIFPESLTPRDSSILEIVFGDEYFRGADKIDFSAVGTFQPKLLETLTQIFWETHPAIDISKVRSNWERIGEVVDAAVANGCYPGSNAWI